MASATKFRDERVDIDAHDEASQIRRDIEHTRHEMDETLDELAERLTVHHMMESAMDYIRDTTSRKTEQAGAKLRSAACQVTDKIKQFPMSAAAIGVGLGSVSARRMGMRGDGLRCTADSVTRQVRQNPIPTALIGAGLAWLAYSRLRDDGPHRFSNSGHWSDERPRGYGLVRHGSGYQCAPAWHRDYDWSQSQEDEQSWTERARSALHSVKTSLGDASKTAAEKIRHASSALVDLCGHSPEQIRDRMHRQWADLEERSGSFVDARTGEPYDSTYGEEWRNLTGVHCLAEGRERDSESPSWGEKAEKVVADLQQSLATAGTNVRDTLHGMTAKLGEFGHSVGDTSSRMSSRAAERVSEAWERASSGTRHMSHRAMEMGGHAQEKIGRGYRASRDTLAYEIDEHPLAVAAAALGLGMLAGFLIPSTETEDRLMGEASDELKDRAREYAEQGKEVVQATGRAAFDQLREEATDLAEDALDRGREVAQSTGQMALDEARKHGIVQQPAAGSGEKGESHERDKHTGAKAGQVPLQQVEAHGAACATEPQLGSDTAKQNSGGTTHQPKLNK